jgi:cytochrome oxidase Cu insertion factor (SCO1/SenC/PrrC family)
MNSYSTFVRRLAVVTLSAVAMGASAAQDVYAVHGPWIDDAEQVFALESLSGTYTVAAMAYGACQRVCSTTLRRLEELQRLAARRGLSLNFVVFGLDPAEDRPSDWAALREHDHIAPSMRFLSGHPAAVRRVATTLGVRYWHYGEHTMHDFRIVLLSPEGRIVRTVDHFDDDIASLLP